MTIAKPQLVPATESLASMTDELIAFADDICEDQYHLLDPILLRHDPLAYLCMLDKWSQGIGLPDGWIPASQFWYIDQPTVIGFSSLRHYLTPSLEDFGGHISYVVRPEYRGKGHGTQLLGLTLNKAKDLNLDHVLLTTDVDNIASRKVIEHNGGEFKEEYMSAVTDTLKARYWISLISM